MPPAPIPKRATQHGIFVGGQETEPPTLKPGQTELWKKEVFAEEARPTRETFVSADQFQESMYSKTMASVLLPEDYMDPVRPMRPPPVTAGSGNLAGNGTAHWRSEYKATLGETSKAPRNRTLACNLLHPPVPFGRMEDSTSYKEEFGVYGSDPRSKIVPGMTRLPITKHSLNAGTTKGTGHIPGYQGFVPGCPRTAEAARAEAGLGVRSGDKTNLVETFHTNLVGYAGHIPVSARNDRSHLKLTPRGPSFNAAGAAVVNST